MNLKKTKQWKAVGGLSSPQKMPCYSYSIPSKYCKVGSDLKKDPKSVCSCCYASKGRYLFTNVRQAQERRYQSLRNPDWVENMVWLLKNQSHSYFRWHDSGDIQDFWHLENIVEVARRCSNIQFWLPTKEIGIMQDNRKRVQFFPRNLTVRISAPLLNEKLPRGLAPSSMVIDSLDALPDDAVLCSAYENEKCKCMDCRDCWDPDKKVIAYKKQ